MNTEPGQFLEPYLGAWLPWLYGHSYWWTVLGFAGSAMFGSRFILQWLASEKRQELFIPGYFWHLSFWGSVVNLIYAFHIDNAPIIFGVLALPFIYGRNLILLQRGRRETVVKEESKSSPTMNPSLNPT